MISPAYSTATELISAIREKRICCRELLDVYHRRFERLNPAINAIVAVDFEQARLRAAAADEALARGAIWGPLHGLPMTIKDSFEIAGIPCTAGTQLLARHMPNHNAEAVAALIRAGAVIFGKTNLPAFAQDFQTYNDVFGQTNNPWDLSKTPGGSSGGAAAALCAGMTALDIGSDLGGSIRNPAHFCGLYGHKPSFNLVSLQGHIPPMPGAFPGDYAPIGEIAVAGPLARSARDLKLVMDLLVKPSKPDRVAWRLKLPPPRRERFDQFKIGLWMDDVAVPVDRQVGDCIQKMVDGLVTSGARIEDRKPDIDFSHSYEVFWHLIVAATGAGLPQKLFDNLYNEAKSLAAEDNGPEAQRLRAMIMMHRQQAHYDHQRSILRQKWADFFKSYDLLLCPVVPMTAFPHDHSDYLHRTIAINGRQQPYMLSMAAWPALAGVAHLPATVVPVGFAENGLPVGMQIIGPYLEDNTTLHFAHLLEDITGGFRAPPGWD